MGWINASIWSPSSPGTTPWPPPTHTPAAVIPSPRPGARSAAANFPTSRDRLTSTRTAPRFYKPDDGGTYLTDANDKVILYLPRKDGTRQNFTDDHRPYPFRPRCRQQPAGGKRGVRRLSSEGECTYTHTGTLPTITAGSKTYTEYFLYTCYVGPGWYGNVGVNINSSKGPNVCVGDSGFNGGQANGTTISAHPQLSYVRTYRGFRSSATASGYQSTGVKGGTQYGTIGSTGPSAATTFVNHDFLLADLGKKTSCATQMPTSLFAANAGAYVCISPDNLTDVTDQCPSVWPLTPTSGSGSVTYALTVTPAGNGTGNVTSDTGGIACGSNCSAVIAKDNGVVLTAAPVSGSTFDGWTNCPSGNTGSTCTLTMSNDVEVGAIFNTGVVVASYTLAVGKSGSGTVTGSIGRHQLRQRLFGHLCVRHLGHSDGRSRQWPDLRRLERRCLQRFDGDHLHLDNVGESHGAGHVQRDGGVVHDDRKRRDEGQVRNGDGQPGHGGKQLFVGRWGRQQELHLHFAGACRPAVHPAQLTAPGASKPSDNYDLTKTVTANCGTQSPPSTNF